MSNTTAEHEKLFDEICNKLNELSHREDNFAPQSSKIEKILKSNKKSAKAKTTRTVKKAKKVAKKTSLKVSKKLA